MKRSVDDVFSSSEEGELSYADEDNEIASESKLNVGDEETSKIEKMTEVERERYLFEKDEERAAIQAREAVRQRLKMSANSTTKSKTTTASAMLIFSSSDSACSSDEDFSKSKRSKKEAKTLVNRKAALKNKNSKIDKMLAAQVSKRREKEARQQSVAQINVADVFGSDDDNHPDGLNQSGSFPKKSAAVTSSKSYLLSSSSENSSSNGESNSDSDDKSSDHDLSSVEISDANHLRKMQLSRTSLEKWVHMPFFDQLVVGCFVRVNIGTNPKISGPLYRCAEVIGAIESSKVYELGTTRTNKALQLRIGISKSNYRLIYVSNTPITQDEFDYWLRHAKEHAGHIPTLADFDRKKTDILNAMEYRVQDTKTLNSIVESKKRFNASIGSFALKKQDLVKYIEMARNNNDLLKMRQHEDELKDLEHEAESIERKRTAKNKIISYINQRNRLLNEEEAEKALKLEEEENRRMEDLGGDPFRRKKTQPTPLSKQRDMQAIKKSEDCPKESVDSQIDIVSQPCDSNNSDFKSNCQEKNDNFSIDMKDSIIQLGVSSILQDIHDFDISIDLPFETNGKAPLSDNTAYSHNSIVNKISNISSTLNSPALSTQSFIPNFVSQPNSLAVGSKSKSLNLEEYKRRKGLI